MSLPTKVDVILNIRFAQAKPNQEQKAAVNCVLDDYLHNPDETVYSVIHKFHSGQFERDVAAKRNEQDRAPSMA